eukprot:TRINITY_DN123223_c0_g1_i1.p1 TRINITY_DN123223_c0_g1~~TRINITY_DN123223_c0_g1_i1.p1  ORF type:complete len:720 (+),score=110.89 TRINITY_DN123223_c0_g1_i1:69-2228(+)
MAPRSCRSGRRADAGPPGAARTSRRAARALVLGGLVAPFTTLADEAESTPEQPEPTERSEGNDYCFTLLHVNDVHSRVLPVNEFTSTCKEEPWTGKCSGGAAHLWGAIGDRHKRLTEEGKHVIVLDNGDQFQGSPFYTFYKGNLTARILGSLGYLEAQGCGNHEFDYGPEALATYLRLVKEASHPFPFRAHNIDVANDPHLGSKEFEDSFYPKGYKIIELGGRKVAIIGITTEMTVETSQPGQHVIFRDSVDALNALIPRLRTEEGVEHVVVNSHSGVVRDKQLADEVPDLDVIVGGHSHTLLTRGAWTRARKPILQVGAYGMRYGEVEVCFPEGRRLHEAQSSEAASSSSSSSARPAGDSRRRVRANIRVNEVRVGRVPVDHTIHDIIEDARPALDAWTKTEVGELTQHVEGRRMLCRTGDCEGGRLLAMAFLHSDFAKQTGAQYAMIPGGNVRAGLHAGKVTFGDVLTACPFQNSLAVCTLKGDKFREMLEHGVADIFYTRGRLQYVGGAFPHLASLNDFSFVWNPHEPAGRRITKTVPEIVDDASYRIVTSSFVRGGGDGYKVFAEHCEDILDFGPTDADEVAAFIKRNTPLDPTSQLGVRASRTVTQPSLPGLAGEGRTEEDAEEEQRQQAARLRGSSAERRSEPPGGVGSHDYEEDRLKAVKVPSPSASVPERISQAAHAAHGYSCVTGLSEVGHAQWGVCGAKPGEILAKVVV